MSNSSFKLPVVCLLIGAAAGGTLACATAQQPNMYNALASLQNARAELVHAVPNKGGHRERAIGRVDQAIQETQAGIAFAGG